MRAYRRLVIFLAAPLVAAALLGESGLTSPLVEIENAIIDETYTFREGKTVNKTGEKRSQLRESTSQALSRR